MNMEERIKLLGIIRIVMKMEGTDEEKSNELLNKILENYKVEEYI